MLTPATNNFQICNCFTRQLSWLPSIAIISILALFYYQGIYFIYSPKIQTDLLNIRLNFYLKSLQNISAFSSSKLIEEYWLLNPPDCTIDGHIPLFPVFISSRPSDFKMRAAVRETWGQTAIRCNILPIFIFGFVNDDALQVELENEATFYQDLLQSKEIKDSYHNQTELVLFGLRWGLEHCQSKFLAKGDDDTWLNIPKIIELLKETDRIYNETYYILGSVFEKNPVLRVGKHALTKEEYPNDYYPMMVAGPLYMSHKLLLSEILRISSTFDHKHWIDDAFLTGDVIYELNKELVNKNKTLVKYIHLPLIQNENYFGCGTQNQYVIHYVNASQKRDLHNLSCLKDTRSCPKIN